LILPCRKSYHIPITASSSASPNKQSKEEW
jgi:hypothetical protein